MEETTMRLRKVSPRAVNCRDDGCPAVFVDEAGKVFVQGQLVSDREALEQASTGTGEALVAVPREMLVDAARVLGDLR